MFDTKAITVVASLSARVKNFRHLIYSPPGNPYDILLEVIDSKAARYTVYTFLTCASAFQHMLDLCSPTHGSRGIGVCYTLHISSAGQEKLGQELKQVKWAFGRVVVWFWFLMVM